MSGGVIEPATRIADFVVDAVIGVGGMGKVYRAHQVGIDRPVALKVLDAQHAADPEFVARFRREATLMRDLEHPSIVTVYAAGEDAGTVYLAAKLVTGPNLAQLLAGRAPMTAAAASDILRPIAQGLDYAHGRGVVHRDVKPANILVDGDGRAFLADFGISKQLGSVSTTVTGQYLGTPRYMAPEQAVGGAIGHRADLYALACVAFEMLTGSAPYTDADTIPLAVAHATKPVPRASAVNPALPGAVDAVFERGLAKEPAARFPSAGSIVEALEAALAGAASPRRAWRRPALLTAGAAAVVAVVLAVVALQPVAPPPVNPVPVNPVPDGPGLPVTEPVSSPSAAELSGVPRGDRVYAAALDGTARGFVVSSRTEPKTPREAIRYISGALELEAVEPGADTYSELDVANPVTTYIGEMDLSVRPGTDVKLCWSLRWAIPRQLSNYWCADTAAQTAQFSVFRRGEGRLPLGDAAPLAGLQTGRTVRVAVVLRDQQLSMYVDGRLVVDVVNDQVPVSGTLPGIELESTTGTGLVRIEGLRIYDLGRTP